MSAYASWHFHKFMLFNYFAFNNIAGRHIIEIIVEILNRFIAKFNNLLSVNQ